MVLYWWIIAYKLLFLSLDDSIRHTHKEILDADSGSYHCYMQDSKIKDNKGFKAHLIITLDENGYVKSVDVGNQDNEKMKKDPAYRVFIERTKASILNPACSK